MKILSWNIQGGKKPQALAELIFLKKKFKPDIIFIMETLTNHVNSRKILNALHFDNKLIIDPLHHCGGFWVAWNNSNIMVLSHDSHPRCATLNITYKPTNKKYTIIGVYCPPQEEEKDALWNYLHNFVSVLSEIIKNMFE